MFSRARLPLAEAYAGWLADAGTVRGLIGPREVPRLWERHLLNCAVLADAIPEGSVVCDLGSGAGLPGLVLAIARPDLRVTLVEPLLRRTTFLDEVVADLGLGSVEVLRGRAEDLHGERTFDVVTSRAVAPLERLLAWSMPLVAPDGALVAMKGSSIGAEIEVARPVLERFRCAEPHGARARRRPAPHTDHGRPGGLVRSREGRLAARAEPGSPIVPIAPAAPMTRMFSTGRASGLSVVIHRDTVLSTDGVQKRTERGRSWFHVKHPPRSAGSPCARRGTWPTNRPPTTTTPPRWPGRPSTACWPATGSDRRCRGRRPPG